MPPYIHVTLGTSSLTIRQIVNKGILQSLWGGSWPPSQFQTELGAPGLHASPAFRLRVQVDTKGIARSELKFYWLHLLLKETLCLDQMITLLQSFLIVLWWIGCWGLVETFVQPLIQGSAIKALVVYGGMIVAVVLIVSANPTLLEKFQ
jgi:hypothetical protein